MKVYEYNCQLRPNIFSTDNNFFCDMRYLLHNRLIFNSVYSRKAQLCNQIPIHTHTHIQYTHTHIHIHIQCTHTHMYICICVYIYIYTHIYSAIMCVCVQLT